MQPDTKSLDMNDEKLDAEYLFNPGHRLLIKTSEGNIQACINEIDYEIQYIDTHIWKTKLNESIAYIQPLIDTIEQTKQSLEEQKERILWHIREFEDEDQHEDIIYDRTSLLSKAILKLETSSSRLIKIKEEIENLNDSRREELAANSTTIPKPIFKLNLTMDETAAFFRIMVELGLLEIPKGKIRNFAKAISNIFLTKGTSEQGRISPKSFTNLYYEKKYDALSTCNAKFSELRKKAKELMDKA